MQPQWTAVEPGLAWDGLVERTADEEMAQTFANNKVGLAEKALDKAQKAKSKASDDLEEFMENERQRKQAIADAQAQLDAWKRIAGVAENRRREIQLQQEAEARRLAAERTEAQKAEREAREEAARLEREALEGIPDHTTDRPADARQRGYRRVDGRRVDRQEPVSTLDGKEVEVRFSKDVIEKGKAAVVEASSLQPSHIQGEANPKFFINEAQPKNRDKRADGGVSMLTARENAHNLRAAEVTGSVTAYSGAPNVNARGEVIQGNGRVDMLLWMYDHEAERAAEYKQYLIDHATELGLDAAAISAMERPVLVNMFDVSDGRAIELGQFTAADTESAGEERIRPTNVLGKMGEDVDLFFQMIMRQDESGETDMSLSELIAANGLRTLQWLNSRGYITSTQFTTATARSASGLSESGRDDLRAIITETLFAGMTDQFKESFGRLPVAAQNAILATVWRNAMSPASESLLSEIQQSVIAYNMLLGYDNFRQATNTEKAMHAMHDWERQTAFDDASGEFVLPSEKFSNFALVMAARYHKSTQRGIRQTYNDIYDAIQGTTAPSLFGENEAAPLTMAEAIEKVLEMPYVSAQSKKRDNGQTRSDNVDYDAGPSQTWRPGGTADSAGGERTPSQSEPAVPGTGAEADSGEAEGAGLTKEELLKVVQDYISKRPSWPVYIISSEADIDLLQADDETKGGLKYLLREGRLAGAFHHNLRSIYVFARQVDRKSAEITIFHENVHAAISKKDDRLTAFLRNYATAIREKVPKSQRWVKAIDKHYNEAVRDEEIFAYSMEEGFRKATFMAAILGSLTEQDREYLLNNIIPKLYGRSEIEQNRVSWNVYPRREGEDNTGGVQADNVGGGVSGGHQAHRPTAPGGAEHGERAVGDREEGRSETIAPEQQALLDERNSRQYPAERERSEGKGNALPSEKQEKGAESLPDGVGDSLGTPQADATAVVGKPQGGNRLVSEERYAELREKMRRKMLGRLNMGVDPEILSIGTEMALYHIEKGARRFAAYARAMIADLGDAIRPYLKSFYNAVRDLPEAVEGGLAEQMDSYGEVKGVDIANFDKATTDLIASAEAAAQEKEVEAQVAEAEATNAANAAIDAYAEAYKAYLDFEEAKDASESTDAEAGGTEGAVGEEAYWQAYEELIAALTDYYTGYGNTAEAAREMARNQAATTRREVEIQRLRHSLDTIAPAPDAETTEEAPEAAPEETPTEEAEPTAPIAEAEAGREDPSTQRHAPTPRKIEDFGQKIAGARKDMLADLARTLESTTEQALVELPLSKAFKRPNLKKLVAEGAITEEEALEAEAIMQGLIYCKNKPTLTRRLSSRREVAAWAVERYRGVQLLAAVLSGSVERRAEAMEQWSQTLQERQRRAQAEVERLRGYNPGSTFEDATAEPDPIEMMRQVLRRLGYRAGDKVELPLTGVRRTLFNPNTIEVTPTGKQGTGGFSRTHSTLESAVNTMVLAAQLKRGDVDIDLPSEYLQVRGEGKPHRAGTGRYTVQWMSGRSWLEREFDSQEKAQAFADKKQSSIVKEKTVNTGEYDSYCVRFANPLTGEAVVLKGGYPTKAEASAALEAEYDNLVAQALESNAKAQNVQHKREHFYVSVTFKGREFLYSVIEDDPNNPWPIVADFASRGEAEKWLAENMERLESERETRRRAEREIVYFDTTYSPRRGPDRRKGRDVTPEMFGEAFGFRGVQFGNWTNDADRQAALNQAYDAFMDMAEALGLPARFMSLGGELGLAFGARGSGGALAHYEPGEVVINLTKTNGAGSLAHEWWHAIDNYYSRHGGVPGGFLSHGNGASAAAAAISSAAAVMMRVLAKTDYMKRSVKKGAYWSRGTEVTARLFAEWINLKLGQGEISNAFLSRGVSENVVERYRRANYDRYSRNEMRLAKLEGREPSPMTYGEFIDTPQALTGFPYPAGAEVGELGEYMQTFFDAVRTAPGPKRYRRKEKISAANGSAGRYSRAQTSLFAPEEVLGGLFDVEDVDGQPYSNAEIDEALAAEAEKANAAIGAYAEAYTAYLEQMEAEADEETLALADEVFEAAHTAVVNVLKEYYRAAGNSEIDAERMAYDQARRARFDVERWRYRFGNAVEGELEVPVKAETGGEAEFRIGGGEIVRYNHLGGSVGLGRVGKGEFTHVERVFAADGSFSFTGKEKIETTDDIAYIFRELEDYSCEHAFVVCVRDGVPTVVHVGMGTAVATLVNEQAVRAAVDAFAPEQIYFVHNHPSGNLNVSSQDEAMMKKLEKVTGMEVRGIIIDTTSGRYLAFNAGATKRAESETANGRGDKPLRLLSFGRQVFSAEYDHSKLTQINEPNQVAAYISTLRLGERAKIGYLILDHQNRIVGNLHTPHTSYAEDAAALAHEMTSAAIHYGGAAVIPYGNAGLDNISRLREAMRGEGDLVRLLDVLSLQGGHHVSALDSGRLYEPESAYAGSRYRMGDDAGSYRARQAWAVANRGTVMAGLNEATVAVVDVPRHPYGGSMVEAKKAAIADAVEKYTELVTDRKGRKERKPKLQSYDNFGVSFTYTISKESIEESVNGNQLNKSKEKGAYQGVHIAVLNHLDRVIGESIEVEEHPDYTEKDAKEKRIGDKYNPNILMHRFVGAVSIEGALYRVKITMKEHADTSMENTQYAYEVAKIEVLNDNSSSTSNGVDKSASSREGKYPTAKLLQGVEKSYDEGVKILEESAKSDALGGKRWRLRTKEAPKRTGKGYKVFVLKDGKLYPPMVANADRTETPVGVWLDADANEHFIIGREVADAKQAHLPQWLRRYKVKAGGKGTQGGSGTLSYRPGWHLGQIPYALQFQRQDEAGERILFPADFVWAEVEYAADVDYQAESDERAMHNYQGKRMKSTNNAMGGLNHIPEDGSYTYRTNPDPNTDPWIITGAMRVNRILTPGEVDAMVRAAGREPQRRQSGAVTDAQVESLNAEIAKWGVTTEEAKRGAAEGLAARLGVAVRIVRAGDVRGEDAEAKGWYDVTTGEVVVVVDNNANAADVEATVLHEVIGHKGLRELVGAERFGVFLDEVYSHAAPSVRAAINALVSRNGWDVRLATEEYIAQLAEKGFEDMEAQEQSFWAKVKAKVLEFLGLLLEGGRIPGHIRISDNEIRWMLWESYRRRTDPTLAGEARAAAKHHDLAVGRWRNPAMSGESNSTEPQISNVEIDEAMAPQTRAEALERLSDMTQPFHNNDQGVEIYVSNRDARHTMQFRNADQIKLIGGIDRVIRNAVKVAEIPVAEDERTTTKAVHIYYCPVKIGSRQYSARLVVKEYFEGNHVVNELHLYNTTLKQHPANTLSPEGTPHMRQDAVSGYKVSELIFNEQDLAQYSANKGKRFRKKYGSAREEYDDRVRAKTVRDKSTGLVEVGSGGNAKRKVTAGAFNEAYMYSMRSVRILQEAITRQTGEPVEHFENAYWAENRMSSSNRVQTDAWKVRYFEPLYYLLYNISRGFCELYYNSVGTTILLLFQS